MSHVSSIVNSTYPYRGTLSRLDTNGDGMLSQTEISAGDRPGLLSMNSVDDTDGSDGSLDNANSPLSAFVAKLLQLPTDSKSSKLVQPGAASDDTSSTSDTQTPSDLYQATYGQYAMDDIAA